ncbi:MAG TPA: regulatory iron-sulfur-containing complex subunit RicT [Polyangia bacterium]|nr:regulatory iron-sulfur-containing complex subunit RicT [Polyangia bacterium]
MSDERRESDVAAPDTGPPLLNVVGVKLSATGRTFAADAGALSPRAGTRVVIDDGHGTAVAIVAVAASLRAATPPLPRVLRVADARDLAHVAADEARVAEVLAFARERAKARNLPIKMFRVELPRAGGRALFYFAAEQRVDFRDLVRDLAAKVRARVELRQVGVRDEAKMVGGIGSCGRELCCSTFLQKFAPVSIKMAKNQNIALNPTKVSGQCGRLKCCLVYEEANYVEAARRLPRAGKRVQTPDGVGRVGDVDVLRERIRVYFEDQPPKIFTASEVSAIAGPPGARPDGEPDHHDAHDETPPDDSGSGPS